MDGQVAVVPVAGVVAAAVVAAVPVDEVPGVVGAAWPADGGFAESRDPAD